jgi:hypothetical protein
VILLVLLAIEVFFASQMHQRFSPNVFESNRIFNLQDQRDLKINLNVNVLNGTSQFTQSHLKISALRGPDDTAWAIFDVYSDLNVPLEPRLRLKFSIFASQLNLTTDSARIYLTLINGTHAILLFYVVGFKMPDLIPDPSAQIYSYVFYQVGNASNIWVRGDRNLWADLNDKGLSPDSSWSVVKVIFGVISHVKGTDTSNYPMESLFDLDENSVYYENLTFATVSPSDEEISWVALIMMVSIVFFFIVVSYATTAHEKMTKRSVASEKFSTKILIRPILENEWKSYIGEWRKQ